MLAAAPVFAQGRQSLADRVARIEAEQQRLSDSSQHLELLNRITDLQAEIMSLRGMVERQQFEIEQIKQRSREQYLDLDGRLQRLEIGVSASDGEAIDFDSETASVSAAEPSTGIVAGALDSDGAPPAPMASADGMPEGERDAYDHGFNALKDGEYAVAARRFQAFLRQFPDGQYAPNASYWLGESYYVTQNYELALDTFQSLLERHPDSAKAPDALLKLGYCQYELKRFTEARATLERVVEIYPDSTVARLAQGRLRQMMLDAGN